MPAPAADLQPMELSAVDSGSLLARLALMLGKCRSPFLIAIVAWRASVDATDGSFACVAARVNPSFSADVCRAPVIHDRVTCHILCEQVIC